MELTKEQLKQLLPKNPYIDQWYNALSQLLPDYEINTPQRIAAFMAQCAHESGEFMFLSENLNYKAASLRKLFGKYFPNDDIANEYASKPNKQEAIANRIYASRMGNGPEASGEGFKFRGRGFIQLTGRARYSEYSAILGIDLVADPTLALDPTTAARMATIFRSRCVRFAAAHGRVAGWCRSAARPCRVEVWIFKLSPMRKASRSLEQR